MVDPAPETGTSGSGEAVEAPSPDRGRARARRASVDPARLDNWAIAFFGAGLALLLSEKVPHRLIVGVGCWAVMGSIMVVNLVTARRKRDGIHRAVAAPSAPPVATSADRRQVWTRRTIASCIFGAIMGVAMGFGIQWWQERASLSAMEVSEFPITPEAIWRDAQSRVPYQQYAVGKKYENIPVGWTLPLFHVEPSGSDLILVFSGRTGQLPAIGVSVAADEYPAVKDAPKGTLITIHARIARVTPLVGIQLRDAKLVLPK